MNYNYQDLDLDNKVRNNNATIIYRRIVLDYCM